MNWNTIWDEEMWWKIYEMWWNMMRLKYSDEINMIKIDEIDDK